MYIYFTDKEKQDRLHKAELVAAHARILSLENQIHIVKSSNKRARTEMEMDIQSEKEQRRVRLTFFLTTQKEHQGVQKLELFFVWIEYIQ